MAVGCQSGQYTPSTLPRQFLAARPHSVHSVDLSRLSNASSGGDILQPGDMVEVTVATGVEETAPPKWELRIANNALLDVPLIGPVQLEGVTPTAAESRIREQAIQRGLYIDPKVTVTVKKKQTNRVTVAGAVNAPASYELPVASSDLLNSITMANGFTDEAGSVIEIRHPPGFGPQEFLTTPDGQVIPASASSERLSAIEVDLARLEEIGPDHLKLYDGSVVTVKKRKKRTVSVMGLVHEPGTIEMPEDEPLTLLDAISEAGSTRVSFADRVQIIRRGPDGQSPVVIDASIREAKMGGEANLELAAGDVVSVEETPTTFAVETIRTFFRVGFSAAIPGL